ncbi:MAG: cobaltochelatase subunit CobN, partial [Psychrosphaera sp.]|nr:cobaltochelatase subunit CobN [Psychrosphaera sp.]
LVLSSSTEQDWQDFSQGLRSRDIAMQIVLPEMDGRIITRAISFKAQAFYSERCQTSIVSYALHKERANFVVSLAKKYCQLATKPNEQKRIGLILANYPTKDGRIGNGVGLDTPASTINILQALQDAAYPVEGIPDTGTDLIKALLGAVTNNPDTIDQLPCWQSLAVDEYMGYFRQLPEADANRLIHCFDQVYQSHRESLQGDPGSFLNALILLHSEGLYDLQTLVAGRPR